MPRPAGKKTQRVRMWTSVTTSGQSGATPVLRQSSLQARSICVIRKLRTCPARAGSALRSRPAAGLPPSLEHGLQGGKIRSRGFGASLFAGAGAQLCRRHEFLRPVRLRLLPDSSTSRPVTTSPSLCSARYSSRPVGTSCFMLSLIWRFSGSIAELAPSRPGRRAGLQPAFRCASLH